MNALRSLDFFQKISVDNITKPTLVGSLLSIGAIGIMLFLLFREIRDLLTFEITKNSHVVQDNDQKTRIKVNLEFRFPSIPCNLISVDQEDSIGNHRMDITDSLNKEHLEKDSGNSYFYDKHTNTIETLIDAIVKNRGCKVSGVVPISKVPGDIHISFHNYAFLYQELRETRKDLFDKLSMTHRLNVLTFGDAAYNQKLLTRFGFGSEAEASKGSNSFNQNANLPNFERENKPKNFDYFVKLIPHYFEDLVRGTRDTGYQFSMTSRSREFDKDSDQMPIVVIHYDFSPIAMVLQLNSKSLLHFLTHVCAIIGGVYVIFSMLNRLLVAFFDNSQ